MENLQSVAVVTNLVIKRQINTRVCVGSDWKERTWTVWWLIRGNFDKKVRFHSSLVAPPCKLQYIQ
jgi:hypothetical protein